jgi:CBS domain-containing protein
LEESLDVMFDHLPRPFAYSNDHLYDVLLKMSTEKLSVLPVLNEQEEYQGCISIYQVMGVMSDFGSLKEHGGILILEVNAVDYSMVQIAQIIESNSAKILSSYITATDESTIIEVTLKINQSNLSRIIQTFERYDYVVKAAYQDKDAEDDLRGRFDTLMNFLKF